MNEGKPLKILLVDDHRLVADGLRALLSHDDFTAAVGRATDVALAASAAEAREALAAWQPDLVLLDLAMPEQSGFTLLETLARQDDAPTVVILSASTNAPDVRRARELGAQGFVSKFESSSDLIAKIALVVRGGTSYPENLFLTGTVPEEVGAAGTSVTPRQREVLELMADGLSNRAIAESLAVSTATVKFHVSELFRQLEVNNRTRCVSEAIRRGILARPV